MNKLLFAGLGLSVLLASCTSKPGVTNSDKRTVFFDTSGMDKSVSPGEDFFSYANGLWMKNTEIPGDKSGWGSFNIIAEDNRANLRKILEDLAGKKDLVKGSVEQKMGDFFASAIDSAAIEKAGYEPLKPIFAQIDAITDYKGVVAYAAGGFVEGRGDLIGLYVGADEKNSTMNIANLYQDGINLPEKDYYLKTDDRSKDIRAAYVEYVSKMFQLTGSDAATADKMAQQVLALETEIAKSHRSQVELRDPKTNYNKMSVADLQKMTPNIDWASVLTAMNMKTDSLNVGQPGYYKALSALLTSQSIDAWKTKLKLEAINGVANHLSQAFRETRFNFYGKKLNGQKQMELRWKQAVSTTDNSLPELLGQVYVKNYFTAEAKKRMDELVTNLTIAYKARLEKLDWMSPETKTKALQKLSTIMRKVGYPDKWKNYDDVTVDRNNYFANIMSARKHGYAEMAAKLGKPVDKTEWGMSTPTVNAYYNPSYNEIVFPAGILQFPFFDPNADDAINYGGIGMVIGHEITHGFDDQGRQYDHLGNMVDWWTADDATKFNAKTGQVVEQYNAFTVLDDQHVNGELTLGENIADFGGIAISYDAFKLTKQGQSDEKIDGFTPDQRFFLGFAQVWRVKRRDEKLRVDLTTDPHSPAKFRVNGPLSNFEPFYKAFGVKEGDKMWKPEAERAKVW